MLVYDVSKGPRRPAPKPIAKGSIKALLHKMNQSKSTSTSYSTPQSRTNHSSDTPKKTLSAPPKVHDFNPTVKIGDDDEEDRLLLDTFRTTKAALVGDPEVINLDDDEVEQAQVSALLSPSQSQHNQLTATVPLKMQETHPSAPSVATSAATPEASNVRVAVVPGLQQGCQFPDASHERTASDNASTPSQTPTKRPKKVVTPRKRVASECSGEINSSPASTRKSRKTVYLQCPICTKYFKQAELEDHASICTDFQCHTSPDLAPSDHAPEIPFLNEKCDSTTANTPLLVGEVTIAAPSTTDHQEPEQGAPSLPSLNAVELADGSTAGKSAD